MDTTPYLIWDWNGTLLDDVDAGVNALNRMLAARKLPTITRDIYRAHFGFPVRPFYTWLGMDPDHEWDRICVEFHDLLHEEPQHIRPDAVAALEYVRAHGVRQSILSALRQDLLLRDTATEGVQDFFDEIYGVDNLSGATKLSRGHDLIARLGATGALPSGARLLFVGDTLHDAEVGTALGATPVLVAGGHQSAARLRAACEGPDARFPGVVVATSLLDAVKTLLPGNTF